MLNFLRKGKGLVGFFKCVIKKLNKLFPARRMGKLVTVSDNGQESVHVRFNV
jgi:hypothetical protein